MKRCLKCGTEIEDDDNFCPSCGHWTARGYSFFKDSENSNIINGKLVKIHNRMRNLFISMIVFAFLAVGLCFYRGKNIIKPFIYMRRQFLYYQYGYITTVLQNDNKYFNVDVGNLEIARDIIKQDYDDQEWQCKTNIDVFALESELEENYDIISVNFCDMSYEDALLISEVIKNMYSLFPQVKGYLTNISITNSINKTDYVAYFQPVYQFVNSASDINTYNRVNKTEILFNSYYFLNDNEIKSDWYVKDATLESLIAHEFGHYITFVALLKQNDVYNVIFETSENTEEITNIKNIVNSQSFSLKIVNDAITNYNQKYKTNYDVLDFTAKISNYAMEKDINGNFNYDEIIAEAIHDYYLHSNSCAAESLEIVNIIYSMLG